MNDFKIFTAKYIKGIVNTDKRLLLAAAILPGGFVVLTSVLAYKIIKKKINSRP